MADRSLAGWIAARSVLLLASCSRFVGQAIEGFSGIAAQMLCLYLFGQSL